MNYYVIKKTGEEFEKGIIICNILNTYMNYKKKS